ncbi:MAG: DUF4241 domain-containing protein [Bacteroidia bacterium]|nr:DUF4241 domain-containing protein [Bacteroidia bacterium]
MKDFYQIILRLPQAKQAQLSPLAKVVDIGHLHVSTNSIVACDPLYSYGATEPFTQKVPNGDFPVRLYYTREFGQRIAFAVLQFKDQPVHHWQMALRGDERSEDLAENEFYGYEVEAGMGCFKDEKASALYYDKILTLRQDNGPGFNHYKQYIEPEMEKQKEFDYLNLRPSPEHPHNVIMFSSGIGDGLYPSYFGLDENDEVVCLLTDFLLFRRGDYIRALSGMLNTDLKYLGSRWHSQPSDIQRYS